MANKSSRSITGSRQVRLMLNLLLPLTVMSVGCEEPHAAHRVTRARSAMQSQLDSMKHNNDGSTFHRYLIESLEEGLRKLDALPGGKLAGPMPILAIRVGEETKEGERWALSFQWIEQDFDATGFYLVDTMGNVAEYANSFPWDRSDMDFLASTAWRETWVPLVTSVSDESWQDEMAGRRRVHTPVVIAPLDFSKGDIRLGLMTKAGRKNSTVVVGFRDVQR